MYQSRTLLVNDVHDLTLKNIGNTVTLYYFEAATLTPEVIHSSDRLNNL